MPRTCHESLILIPARGGSKEIPNKNMTELNGSPLLAWTAQVAINSSLSEFIVLSTDSKIISEYAQSLGLFVPFMRPAELATDTTLQIDVIKHTLLTLTNNNGINFESVVLLQPTSPFRTTKTLVKAFAKFKELNADTLVSITDISNINETNTYSSFEHIEDEIYRFTDELNMGSKKPRGTIRQDFSKKWHRNGAIYIFKVSTLLSTDSLYGGITVGMPISLVESINIDSKQDLELARLIAPSLKN
jgi:CMP-N,N'-diacetyllegionaminic acid synthase